MISGIHDVINLHLSSWTKASIIHHHIVQWILSAVLILFSFKNMPMVFMAKTFEFGLG